MDLAYRLHNDAALARLRALAARLTPEDLDRPLGDGWTVKAALMHLGFWDRLAAAFVRQWQREGFIPSGDDAACINVAGLNDWLAASSEYALHEVLRTAEAANSAAASIDDALRAAIIEGGEGWVCERHVHRNEHIDQIERAKGPR